MNIEESFPNKNGSTFILLNLGMFICQNRDDYLWRLWCTHNYFKSMGMSTNPTTIHHPCQGEIKYPHLFFVSNQAPFEYDCVLLRHNSFSSNEGHHPVFVIVFHVYVDDFLLIVEWYHADTVRDGLNFNHAHRWICFFIRENQRHWLVWYTHC